MKIYKIKVNGKTYKVELEAIEEVASEAKAETKKAEAPKAEAPKAASSGSHQCLSPIQGSVVAIKVAIGDQVKKGQVIAVVEAMKLENDVVSEYDGEVAEILVAKGSQVQAKGAILSLR